MITPQTLQQHTLSITQTLKTCVYAARVVARPILVVDNKSNFVGSLLSARGSTKLFMFNYGAVIAEVGPGSQIVRVMGPCNKLKGLLIVFFLCDI